MPFPALPKYRFLGYVLIILEVFVFLVLFGMARRLRLSWLVALLVVVLNVIVGTKRSKIPVGSQPGECVLNA